MRGVRSRHGSLVYTLRFHRDARIDVGWKLAWKAPDHDAFELGMTMNVPRRLDMLGWYRDTLWTCHPPGHLGVPEGTVKDTALSFRCSKLGLHWAALSGAGPVALTVLKADSPLDFRARKNAGQTVLFLSSAIGPPRDFSTNLVSGYEIHLLTGQTYSGAFTVAASPSPRVALSGR